MGNPQKSAKSGSLPVKTMRVLMKFVVWKSEGLHCLSTKKILTLSPSKDYISTTSYFKANEPVVGYRNRRL
jgi:hypothetical protein